MLRAWWLCLRWGCSHWGTQAWMWDGCSGEGFGLWTRRNARASSLTHATVSRPATQSPRIYITAIAFWPSRCPPCVLQSAQPHQTQSHRTLSTHPLFCVFGTSPVIFNDIYRARIVDSSCPGIPWPRCGCFRCSFFVFWIIRQYTWFLSIQN